MLFLQLRLRVAFGHAFNRLSPAPLSALRDEVCTVKGKTAFVHALLLLFQPDVLSRLAPPPPPSSWHPCRTPRIVYYILLLLSYPETVSRGCAPGVPVSVRGSSRRDPGPSRLSAFSVVLLTHAFSELDQAPLSKGLLNTSPSV